MKQLIAFLILISFTAQTFGQFFIVADYYFNITSYAKNCVNKYRPELKCNGKCQLMKKIEREEKKDQQNPDRRVLFKSITLSSKSFFASAQSNSLFLQIVYPSLNTAPTIDRTADIFHPPQENASNPYCISSVFISV